MSGPLDHQSEPDLVQELLRRVRAAAPLVAEADLQKIEQSMRQEFGGRRHFLRKGVYKKLTPDEKAKTFKAGLGPGSNEKIIEEFGVSRSTLYRLMKKSA